MFRKEQEGTGGVIKLPCGLTGITLMLLTHTHGSRYTCRSPSKMVGRIRASVPVVILNYSFSRCSDGGTGQRAHEVSVLL